MRNGPNQRDDTVSSAVLTRWRSPNVRYCTGTRAPCGSAASAAAASSRFLASLPPTLSSSEKHGTPAWPRQ
jgi:hypothetical protein